MVLGPILIPLLASNEGPAGPFRTVEQGRMTMRLVRDFTQIHERLEMLAKLPDSSEELPAPIVELLRLMHGIPLLKNIDDPVADKLVNLLLPEISISYGGQIGRWTELATAVDRYGPLLGNGGHKSETRSVLRIHLHKIKVLSHPLFSTEQVAYADMLREYSNYSKLVHGRSMDYLISRLHVISSRLKQYTDRDGVEAGQMMALQMIYHDLLHTLSQLLETRTYLSQVSNSLYTNWQRVKSLRKEKGFSCTSGSLLIRAIGEDGERRPDDSKSRRRKIKVEEDIDIESDKLLAVTLDSLPRLVKDVHTLLAAADSIDAHESDNDFSNHKQWLATAANKLTSPELTPRFAFRLVNKGLITADKDVLDASERSRRHSLQKVRFRCVIRIKDKIISKSRLVALDTSSVDGSILDFMQSFEFRVFNQPQNVSIDLYYSSGTLLDHKEHFAGTCRIPLPGDQGKDTGHKHLQTHSASGYTPIAGWFQFSESIGITQKKDDCFAVFWKTEANKTHIEVY
jgi:hypothetical protein